MEKHYGIKQTDYRLTPEFNKWGCNVRSILRMVEDWSDEEFTWKEIRDITQDAIMSEYVTADMAVKNYIGLSRIAFRTFGNRTSYIMDVGTRRDGQNPTFYGFVKKSGNTEWHYTTGRYTTFNNHEHYILQDVGGNFLFDPYPEDVLDEHIFDTLFRVVE